MINEEMEKIKRKFSSKRITRSRAIVLYCREQCCAGDRQSHQNCLFKGCFLWNFRKGREIPIESHSSSKNPLFKRENFQENPITETTIPPKNQLKKEVN